MSNIDISGLTPEELEDLIQQASLRKTALESSSKAIAIDPEDCGCTDCIIGESIPLECMSDELWQKFLAGGMSNRTGMSSYLLVPEHIKLPNLAHLIRADWEPGMSDYPFSESHCTGGDLHEHSYDLPNGWVYCVTLKYKYATYSFTQDYGKCYKACVNHRQSYGYTICDNYNTYWPNTRQRQAEDSARIMARATGSVGSTERHIGVDGEVEAEATYVRDPRK